MRRLLPVLFVLATLLLAGCATGRPSQRDALERAQYAWSAAVRWNDFEGAVNLIDPALRERLAPTGLEMERFRQVQVSAYRDKGASADPAAGTAMRDIEVGVINRHTQTERTVRHRETWRWDPQARTWWNTSGLPDFWAGQ